MITREELDAMNPFVKPFSKEQQRGKHHIEGQKMETQKENLEVVYVRRDQWGIAKDIRALKLGDSQSPIGGGK